MRRIAPSLTMALIFIWSAGLSAQEEAAPEAPAEAATEAAAEAAPEAVEGAEAKPDAAAGGEEAPEEVLGPGGKPLQTDYPGTEESLRPRMDTDMIQGLEVDPNAPEEAYSLRIQELETKIDDLKEKVFQSKTRIVLLRETLLSGNMAGARAVIIHKTDLGAAFKLREAFYSLDGEKKFAQVDKDGSLSDKTAFEVYNGAISPGNHTLSVVLKYQGSGYGLFTYFEGYDFEIKNSCDFKAEEGKIAQVKVITKNRGNITTSKENQPTAICDVDIIENVLSNDQNVAKSAE